MFVQQSLKYVTISDNKISGTVPMDGLYHLDGLVMNNMRVSGTFTPGAEINLMLLVVGLGTLPPRERRSESTLKFFSIARNVCSNCICTCHGSP